MLGTVNVAATSLNVPEENAGMVTFAFVVLTTVKPCIPGFVSAGSTVTEPWPALTEVKELKLPCLSSVTVSVGVQVPPGPGVGVGVGVGVAPPPLVTVKFALE